MVYSLWNATDMGCMYSLRIIIVTSIFRRVNSIGDGAIQRLEVPTHSGDTQHVRHCNSRGPKIGMNSYLRFNLIFKLTCLFPPVTSLLLTRL